MKLKDLIKEEVEKLFKELKVDEPKGGPFDQVLFGQNRLDSVENEPDNAKEMDLFSAIRNHYEGGDKASNKMLVKYFDSLYKLSKQGKYDKILETPKGIYVYRATVMPIARAAKLIGIPVSELKKEYAKKPKKKK
jgi:hypothetical protein